ncbi:hypothetical protein LAJ19_14940 (plasmid) [Deinococcus taeanensis]|uniref:hypothetical protein n=1 Tax=Deinococcus taeanensis TaxID=2737050 RepID=UPI001CDBF10A|nr:hypothetical protein [Deinococcus taeanensis]UBV44104.1 hypothetical protein LAJ19_14940 [Deinococcus taeanensis]
MPPLPELVRAVQHLILYREGASLHELDVALVNVLQQTLQLPREFRWPDDFEVPSRYSEFRAQISQSWPELGFYNARTGDGWSLDQADEVGDALDDLADIAVDMERALQLLPADVPGALSYLRFTAVTHWGEHVRSLVHHLRFQPKRLPSAEQLQDLLEAALPGGVPDQQGATGLLAFLERLPTTMLPSVDEQWRQVFRFNWYDAPGPAGWHRVGESLQWRSNLPAWLEGHPDDLLAAPGVVMALASSADGYAREAAVRLLADIDLPVTTAALLIRALDWVEPVRIVALGALHRRLNAQHALHWAHCAALTERLDRAERGDADLVSTARELLRTSAGLQAIQDTLPRADRDTRLSLLRVIEELPEPLRATWLGTLAGDFHAPVRRRVAQLASVDQLHDLTADPDAGVREMVLRRLIKATPENAAPAFLLTALLDPRAGVRALAQFEARRRGVNLGEAYLDVDEHRLAKSAVRGWAAGVRELGLTAAEARLETLLEHPNARVRVEVLRALGTLAPHRHVEQLENRLLGSSVEVRVAAVALRAANLLTAERLSALWSRTATDRQRQRLVGLAADLPRFEAVALLLRWRAGTSIEVRTWLDERLTTVLEGYGVRYYTRPGEPQRTSLEQAAQAGGLSERLMRLLGELLG